MNLLGSDCFTHLINSINATALWIDKHSRFIGCNTLFLSQLAAKSQHEIVGLTDYDMPWKQEEINGYIADDVDVIKNGIKKVDYEKFQTNTANKQQKVLLTSKYPLYSYDQQINGLIVFCKDISGKAFFEKRLTKREMACLILVLRGFSHKQIAEALNISTRTVEAYIANMKYKLNVRLRSELIELANEKRYFP